MQPLDGGILLIDRKREQRLMPEDFVIYGLRSTLLRRILYCFLSIASGGLLFLLFRMFPWWRALVKYVYTTLDECDKVLIRRHEEGTNMYAIAHVKVDHLNQLRYFDYMCRRYKYDDETAEFTRVEYDMKKSFRSIQQEFNPERSGYDARAAHEALQLHGKNSLSVPVPNYLQLFIDEVLHPFYAFQVFTCSIWYWDEYWIYATCIVFISVISAIIGVRQARENRWKLHRMTHHKSEVKVIREGNPIVIPSDDVAPGDLVEIETNQQIPCDIILLQGACVINESSLTGESIPVLKSALPGDEDDLFDSEMHTKHVLFNGTSVMQVKSVDNKRVVGVAFGTGFATLKGELIRSIMFPKPTKFAFYRDSFKFVLVLAGIAFAGFIYTVALFVHFGAPITVILKRALDLFTISIPPALPVAMTIGVAYAVDRLQKEGIYCIAPSRVNVAGRVTKMCFDKTGTLTEDGLSVLGVHPSGPAGFAEDLVSYIDDTSVPPNVMFPMAACHSLTLLQGELLGDPLDIQMFKSSEWTLSDATSTQGMLVTSKFGKDSLSIIKYFEFSSLLQRMSVIARHNQTGEIYVFCKGAPEMIKSLCAPQTVPTDFDNVLVSYTHQGKRVIALSSKSMGNISLTEAMKITRQEAELDLEFRALFIMQNKLKGDTTDVIRRLTDARVSSVMVTGDNEYTAINVARECGIFENHLKVYLMYLEPGNEADNRDPSLKFELVPSSAELGHHDSMSQHQETVKDDIDWYDPSIGLAVHAKAFQYAMSFDNSMFTKMLQKAVVYARMSPINKSRLVEHLQSDCGLTVGMCGDGSNDCGALKAADVGLSLSEAEASAAAPFTSKIASIESVYLLLREGRCALSTSIQVYKYMGIYSMIQTVSIIILYSIGYESRLKDPQFLWIDLGLIFPLAFLMSRTHPHEFLSRFRPPASLVNKSIVLSIILQIAVHLIFQIMVYGYSAFSYVPAHFGDQDEEYQTNLKIAILFVFANFQYIWSSLAYSIGRPFRKAFYTNIQYTAAAVVTGALCVYLVFHPDPFTSWLFTLSDWGAAYKIMLIVLALLNFAISWSVERFLIVGFIGEAEGLAP